MSKRKEAGTCSDSFQVYNPEFPHNFTPNSPIECVENPNFKNQKTSITMESNDLGAGFLAQFFDAELNGAPFFDFFAQEKEKIEGFVIQPKKPTSVDVSPDLPVSYSDCGGPSNTGESSECSEDDVIEAVPLRMYRRPESGIDWTLRKVLTASDCNAHQRLLIRKAVMEGHIIPHLNESSRGLIDTLDGLRVNVYDVDKGVELKLTLKKWPSSQCYGLINNRRRDFVNRRGLVPGDDVGIFWDKSNQRFLFSVLCKLTLQHKEL